MEDTNDENKDDLQRTNRMPKFDYAERPLTSPSDIRVLTLRPGDFNAELVIDLDVIPSSKWQATGTYEALSYLWGPPVYSHSITCNRSTLSVTQSLDCALRYLRHPDKSRSIWIDAICINQSDLGERCQQTLLMHDLYRNARSVVGWVGEEGTDSEYPMMLGNHEVGPLEDEPQSSPFTLYMHMAKFCPLEDLQTRFVAFFQRKWFTRTWVGDFDAGRM